MVRGSNKQIVGSSDVSSIGIASYSSSLNSFGFRYDTDRDALDLLDPVVASIH